MVGEDFLLRPFVGCAGTLLVQLADDTMSTIHCLNLSILEEHCPLLFFTFEKSAMGEYRASISATSRAAVVALLRFVYTGNYPFHSPIISLLDHVELFNMACDFDLTALEKLAQGNFNTNVEHAIFFADAPKDLAETISFFYHNLYSSRNNGCRSMLDSLLNYCVSCFAAQRLGEDGEFRKVVYDVPDFYRDLSRTNWARNFGDTGSVGIIHLPARAIPHFTDTTADKSAHEALQFELWQSPVSIVSRCEPDVESEPTDQLSDCEAAYSFVDWSTHLNDMPIVSGSESEASWTTEDDDYALVRGSKKCAAYDLVAPGPVITTTGFTGVTAATDAVAKRAATDLFAPVPVAGPSTSQKFFATDPDTTPRLAANPGSPLSDLFGDSIGFGDMVSDMEDWDHE